MRLFWGLLILAFSNLAFCKALFVVRNNNGQLGVVTVAPESVRIVLAVDVDESRYTQVTSVLSEFVQTPTNLERFQKINGWISDWSQSESPKNVSLKDALDMIHSLVFDDPIFELVRIRWEQTAPDVDRFVLGKRRLMYRDPSARLLMIGTTGFIPLLVLAKP